MATKIGVLNFKGGVAKTTTSINLCAALAKMGKNCLLVDADGQCDASYLLDFHVGDGGTLYDAMRDEFLTKEVDVYEYLPGFDFIAASTELDQAEKEFPKLPMTENRLKVILEPFDKLYDFIIIDCPPNNGVMTDNALTAADYVLIPLSGDDFAMKGVVKIVDRIEGIQKMLNKNLKILGFLFTLYERTIIHKDAVRALEKKHPNKVFETKIRKDVRLKELPSQHQTIYQYAPQSNGAIDYMAAAKELIERIKVKP